MINRRTQGRRQQRGGAINFEKLLSGSALNEFVNPSNPRELDEFIDMLARALERGEQNLVLETVRNVIENYNEQISAVFPVLSLVDALTQQSNQSLQNVDRLNELNNDFRKQFGHLSQ
jgi:cobalamin biosynthesis Mg chelatase CobN